ncbi:hypothetical protein JX266_007632 [Neoarthrinium moseri]|nr:hypothetical protein JX266_007632 [Neoarthrinium moseri]
MDDRRQSMTTSTTTNTTGNRSSALPRPTSRLPQPRASAIPAPASTVRHAASSDGLRGRPAAAQSSTPNDLRAAANPPRLRAPASREQLRGPTTPTSALRKPQRSIAPPLSSQTALRGAAAAAGTSTNAGTRSRSASREPARHAAPPSAGDDRFKKPLLPRRRPSGQFTPALYQQNEAVIHDDDSPSDEPPPPWSASTPTRPNTDADASQARPAISRPSLAERTMETLSQLPSSPAIKRRGSNFFDSEPSSRRPSSRAASGGSRPGSSYQSDGSFGKSLSRPGSSSGPSEGLYGGFKASTASHRPAAESTQGTPSRRGSAIVKPVGLKTPSAASKIARNPSLSAAGPRTPSPEKTPGISVSKYGSRTVAGRSLKPRASLNSLYRKPSLSSLDQAASSTSELPVRPTRKISAASARSSVVTAGEDRNLSSASTVSTALTAESVEESPGAATARKSSAALREQIAKAKAAKRAAAKPVPGARASATPLKSPLIPTDTTFDFGLPDDPFNQGHFEDSNRKVMQSRIETARTTGRLNIAAMGLKKIPDEVVKMYDLESIGGFSGAWAESIDLTRFVAADNELESIDDSIFPDADPGDFADDEDNMGHQFAGLESLDLHGNTLIALPIGLRRLQQLTSLNLTHNKLANGCLEIVSQILPLRDLKLGGNLLYGKMDSCFSALENLEILDLKGNEISALPDGFERLSRLRILNINENAFESLPFGILAQMPLVELLAHKNKLVGTLIDVDVDALTHLQTLDVSANRLTLLALGPISMPSLLQLTVSINRLQSLPDVGSWKSLLTLNADENSIPAIPDGFTHLGSLKHADFTSNDIRVIPPEIARMDSLGMLRIAGNPLRDKRFTSMTTEELKDNLAARLEPLHIEDTPVPENDDLDDGRSDYDNFATPPTSAPQSPERTRSQTLSSQTWPIKTGGILDRANTQSSSLHPVICSKVAADQTVREIRLQHNTFTNMPDSLSFFADTLTSLSIAHNQLVGEGYLTEELDLTALKELNLSHNRITSLAPLTIHLRAPNLQKLDVSFNRIVSLPPLRETFPSLSVLLISNNHLEELDPECVSGLKIVAADSNDIAHLNPRLGLLGFERLEVTGNRFRVPRWNVLERGTEATLRWLRGRVPVAEMAEWRAKQGSNLEEDGNGDEFD